jgi:hypothetical protein
MYFQSNQFVIESKDAFTSVKINYFVNIKIGEANSTYGTLSIVV